MVFSLNNSIYDTKVCICGIYLVSSPSGAIYVGQSTSIHTRFYGYSKLHCKDQRILYHSFKKHGVASHLFYIVELCDKSELNFNEEFYISYLTSIGCKLMNLTSGGDSRILCSETRRLISNSRIGFIKTNKMTLENRMIQYLKVQGCADSTINQYRGTLRLILKFHPTFESYSSYQPISVMNVIPDPITRSNYRNVILKVHRDMLGRQINIPFIKKPERLQKTYTHDEAKKIIGTIVNIKHQAIARLLYVEGMRVGEVVSILLADCNKEDKSIFIRGTKNKKDYKKYIDESTVKCLSEYCSYLRGMGIKLKKYLFEGHRSVQYSKRSIQQIMTAAIKKAGLDKRGSCHVFRRSNATWKIESGWSLKHIAASLNNSEKTVSKYYALVRPDYIKSLPKPAV